jgi:hypothetical protein
MGWTIGVLGFDSRRELGISLFTSASRTALGPTQPPIQCVLGVLFLGLKRPGREADHSPPSNAEVKEWVELYLHSPNTPSRRGAELKHRDNFTYTILWSKGSLVSIGNRLRDERPRFISWQGREFLYITALRLALGPIRLLSKGYRGLSPRV